MFGAGYVTPVHQTYAASQGAEPVFGGSVGYKFAAQTLLGSYSRMVSDSYGLGSYATESSTGAWTWNRPGSSMSLSSGFGYSHLTGGAFSNTTSWTAHVTFTRRLPGQMAMNATYSYVQYPETLLLQREDLALSGVMVGLSWSPSARR